MVNLRQSEVRKYPEHCYLYVLLHFAVDVHTNKKHPIHTATEGTKLYIFASFSPWLQPPFKSHELLQECGCGSVPVYQICCIFFYPSCTMIHNKPFQQISYPGQCYLSLLFPL